MNGTLRANGAHGGPPRTDKQPLVVGPAISHAAGVRRLTPRECERLMSWPDNYTNPHGTAPDSRRYAACGDGVVSNVAEWIAHGIILEQEAMA